MSLPEFLPILRGWGSRYPIKETKTLAPDQTLTLINEEKPGWYGFGMLVMNSPYGILRVEIDEAKLHSSPFDCVQMGLTFVDDHIYCPQYDPLVPIYVLAYTPAIQMPFQKLMVYLENPVKDPFGVPTAALTVALFGACYWRIEGMEEFKESVRELHV